MANLYLLDELPAPGEAALTGPVAHHLTRVLRVRAGDLVALSDGRGRVAEAEVVRTDRAGLVVCVGQPSTQPPVRPQVTLAFACPRQARADWLIEHATEVGVAVFQPLWTARSRPQSLRLDRWRKIARAAAGQSARAYEPQLRDPIELAPFLERPLPMLRLLADAGGGDGLRQGGAADAAVLVGPEGGFTPAEKEQARASGFEPLHLGPHILRTETAALLGAAHLLRGASAPDP
jgi:16S rRNA (uracil1498-N3)-methyltransferase